MKKDFTMEKEFLIFLSIFYILIKIATFSDYTRVFKVNKEEYSLEVVEGKGYDGAGRTEDVFFYQIKRKTEKNRAYINIEGLHQIEIIGCGKLILAGYDADKEYFYGKSEYGNEKRGFGIYQINGENSFIAGDESPKEVLTVNGKEYNADIYLRKQCTGYFVLNLKTSEYMGGII